MTLSELHPDELLWRDACGTLGADERADLTAHLERCPACALERVVRLEAARARVPSEADHALAARLVDRVLATHERRAVLTMGRDWRRPLAVAAAALVLVAGTAFGATALVVRVRAQRAAEALAFSRQASPEARVRRSGTAAARAMSSGAPAEAAEREAPAGDVPSTGVALSARNRRSLHDAPRSRPRPPRSVALAHASSGGRAARPPGEPVKSAMNGTRGEPALAPARAADPVSSTPAPQPAPESAPSPTPAAADAPTLEASHLLRRAEQARTARQWAEAGRAFAELGRRYPGTREEVVGRTLYGQLLLDQLGEPRRALSMFERYLAVDGSGALAEEARVGRAQALRRLERPREERSAWLELLREHPRSVHVAAARTRLAALDAP